MSRLNRHTLKLVLTMVLLMIGHQVYAANQANLAIVLVDVMEDILLPLFLGGIIVTIFGVGIIISSIPAGLIIERNGFKFTLSVGILVFSLFTLLTGFSSSAWDIPLYRIGMGVGEGIWNVAYYSIIGTLFTKRRGFANSIAGNMYPIGLLWAFPLTATILVWSGSWRLPFYFFGLLGFLIFALILLMVRPTTLGWSETQTRTVDSGGHLLSILKNINVVSGCIMGFFYSLVYFSIIGIYPTYLRTVLGFDPILSGMLMSMQTWALFVTSVIILFLSDRYGRKPFLYYTSIFSAFAMYLLFHIPPRDFAIATTACLIYGIAVAGSFPIIIAFVQDSVRRIKIGSATGIVNTAMYIGATAAGLITGFFISSLGWESASLWLITCCLAWFTAAVLAKETRGR